MTRKKLKNELSKLKQFKLALIYGNCDFNREDLDRVNKQIAEVEQLLTEQTNESKRTD